MSASHRIALLACGAMLAAGAGCGGGAPGGQERDSTSSRGGSPHGRQAASTTTARQGTLTRKRPQAQRPRARLIAATGVELDAVSRARLQEAAHRFAGSLTRWLYGNRGRLDVEPTSAAVRQELAASPPYIPADQRGSGEGRVQGLEVALQTARSGIATVTINDLRTSYRIPAGFELRGGRWQIVRLINAD